MNRIFLFSLVLFGLFAFAIKDDSAYVKEIKAWQKQRVENLKKETGWLNLAGLFWLEEKNSFGSDRKNSIVFPKGSANLGELILKNDEVYVKTVTKNQVFLDGKAVENLRIFPYQKENVPTILSHGSLRWFVIKRGKKYAVRLRDLESPFLKNFEGIETFPINPKWKIKAKFVAATGKKIPILDVTGQTNLQESPGTLVFNIGREEYSLDALKEGDHLFILFGDKTNKKQAYGSGRFIDAEMPDSKGFTYLDFNKAYNPPCAFTPYATCPIPPKQNVLPFEILAGEKNYGNH